MISVHFFSNSLSHFFLTPSSFALVLFVSLFVFSFFLFLSHLCSWRFALPPSRSLTSVSLLRHDFLSSSSLFVGLFVCTNTAVVTQQVSVGRMPRSSTVREGLRNDKPHQNHHQEIHT